MLALADLLGRDRLLADVDIRSRTDGAEAAALRGAGRSSVIWLFMEGGPSAMDTFDPKPELTRHHGQTPEMPIDVFFGSPGPLMKSPFAFAQHGESGTWVCDKLPHIARHVDDLALHQIVLRRVACARTGDVSDEHGSDPRGFPERGLVGDLRPWDREPGPARLRGACKTATAAREARATGARASCRPPTRRPASARRARPSST